MSRLRKNFLRIIPAFLLLCFSVTILPPDVFHSHEPVQVCKDSTPGDQCRHKVHVSKKSGLCLVCAVHVEKVFLKEPTQVASVFTEAYTTFTTHETAAYVAEQLLSFLRGPPAE